MRDPLNLIRLIPSKGETTERPFHPCFEMERSFFFGLPVCGQKVLTSYEHNKRERGKAQLRG
jgi:hypothetical protein